MRGLILAAALLLSTTVALARSMPIPLGQWSPAVQLWMARAMVAEAGWLAERDHAGIAYVLSRRWASMRKRYPEIQFVHVIRGYCAGLEPGRAEFTPRQRWLHGLNLQLNEPDGWPRNVSWERHRVWWQQVLQRAEDWSLGKLRDPCKGRAWHWGAPFDLPSGRMRAIDCGDTKNVFYGLSEENYGISTETDRGTVLVKGGEAAARMLGVARDKR